jgi:hypothetical protein
VPEAEHGQGWLDDHVDLGLVLRHRSVRTRDFTPDIVKIQERLSVLHVAKVDRFVKDVCKEVALELLDVTKWDLHSSDELNHLHHVT